MPKITLPIPLRPDFIHRKPILHSHLRRALEKTLLYYQEPNAKIIAVVGSSRVGKKTLRELLVQHFAGNPDNRLCPAAFAVVGTPGGRMNWTDLYLKVQKALGVPLPAGDNARARSNIANAIVNRANRVLILDEAHNMMPSSRSGAEARAATLKSLVEDIPTKLILLGTYALLDLIDATDEIINRTRVVELERYHDGVAAEAQEFSVLLEYLDRSSGPWTGDVRLALEPRLIYSGCIGCVGRLRNWLDDALGYNLDRCLPELTWDAIERKREAPNVLDDLRGKAEAGEARFREFLSRQAN